MPRILLDTNILISGLLYAGKPRKLIEMAMAGRIEIVSSIEMINELREVLSREKFGLGIEQQTKLVDFIVRLSHMVVLKSNFRVVSDPDDDMIINTAYDSNAKYIVSGDHHLLDLGEFKGIRIITASKMLQLLNEK